VVGIAGDVYSLGSTLYVLLTGRTPYQGGTVVEIVEKVKTGRFDPPAQVAAGVPRDLDAVCRKAMAFDPAGRYADARALAADLERWLADEPVSARREPRLERVRRWLRRHRTAAVAGVTALVLVAAGAAVAAVLQHRLVELERATVRQLTETRSLTRKLIVATRQGPYAGRQEQYQALAEARKFFENQTAGGDPQSLFELGAVENTEGVLRLQAGDAPAAKSLFDRAAEVFEQGLRHHPLDLDLAFALAVARSNQGAAGIVLEKPAEAKQYFEQALARLDQFKRDLPDAPQFQTPRLQVERGLATSHAQLGNDAFLANRPDEALREFETAYTLFKQLEPREAELPEFTPTYDGFLQGYGEVARLRAAQNWEAGKRVEALVLYRIVDRVWSHIHRRNPADAEMALKLNQIRFAGGYLAQEYLESAAGLALAAAERRRIAADGLERLDAVVDRASLDPDWTRVRAALAKIAAEAGPT
jgi:tetratricopeptide (TPR) repeat protein